MNLYTEFLVAFILVFAVGYTLAYLPGMLKMKAIYKRNLLFLVSVGLVLQLGNGLKLSYLWAVGFIFLIFNLYLFYTNKRRNLLKVYYAVIDFIVCSLTLFLIRSQKQLHRKSKRERKKCRQQSISIRRSIQNDRL